MQDNKAGHYSLDELLYLMSRLREPGSGCPWDLKQNFKSIAPSTIEEAYEVVDAIEKEDYKHLKEELGDLLFQVVFYSQLGSEAEHFTFADIVHTLTEKLLRRHPHVFPDGTLESRNDTNSIDEAKVKISWEAIKQQERAEKGNSGILDDVPVGLPAMSRAAKLQKRASSIGFDWSEPKAVLDKVREELDELEQAISSEDKSHQAEEFGDVLFSLVNLSRHLKLDAESSIRQANQKFVDRFTYIEERFSKEGRELSPSAIELMELYWNESKSTHI